MSVFPAAKQLWLNKQFNMQRIKCTTQHSHLATLLSKAWFTAYVDDDDDNDDNNNNNKPHCSENFYSTKCIMTLVIHVSVN